MRDDDLVGRVTRLLRDGACDAVAILEMFDLYHAIVAIMEHRPSGEVFITLSTPDGPIFAISPLSLQAKALLVAAVPGARPFEPSGATAWANTQRWQILASQRIERLRQGSGDAHE